MPTPSNFNFDRFTDAHVPVWDSVIAELTAGKKRTHWMWFVFPQLTRLGRSSTSRHFGISNLSEAQEYLAHPVLGPRLRQVSTLILHHTDRSAREIFDAPDDLKLLSCATLFGRASGNSSCFERVRIVFYEGVECQHTIQILELD